MAAAAAISTTECLQNDTTASIPPSSHFSPSRASPRQRRRALRTLHGRGNCPLQYILTCSLLLLALSLLHGSTTSPTGIASSTLFGISFARAEQAYNETDNAGEDEADFSDGMDDAMFQFEGNMDFDDVSIMPVSCVNYHGGNMIKFQFYEKSTSLNCHFKQLGTFVVSIAHYMRAYFNYQALTHGSDFSLPGDVGFLNCVMLKETAKSDIQLYAKIGCQHRDTYTSTKLQLIVYKDAQCSRPYQDLGGRNDGYDINGYFLSKKVSFRPPFYSCQSCLPDEISDKFTKRYTAWYDDDYISLKGRKQTYDDDADGANAADGDDGNNDAGNSTQTDDGSYYKANDDINTNDQAADDANEYGYNNDDAADDGYNYSHYVSHDDEVYYNYKAHDDDFYALNDDGGRKLRKNSKDLDASHSLTAKDALKQYEAEFSQEMSLTHRQLDQQTGNMDNVVTWNMCERVHHYGMWCDEDCRSLDTFRVDEWSRSDVFLLVIMCVFMGAMMLLVFAKRVKAYERAAMWGDEPGAPNPGLPPMAMLMLFVIVFTIIVVLAVVKFVNETLIFAVVTCILLFIYMLKLTLFESRKPQFLPARSTRNHSLKEPFYS
mmetsp:Transcript_21229/g.44116  ORF Transcript_21229/g.44116 Transcript_21229/m.44116 type:complete len:602 (+) Transcript_21229:281-2086(+)